MTHQIDRLANRELATQPKNAATLVFWSVAMKTKEVLAISVVLVRMVTGHGPEYCTLF